MKKIEKEIKNRLITQKNLTECQTIYVQVYIEPKYENECPICRLNVMLNLGVETKLAFAKQQPGRDSSI